MSVEAAEQIGLHLDLGHPLGIAPTPVELLPHLQRLFEGLQAVVLGDEEGKGHYLAKRLPDLPKLFEGLHTVVLRDGEGKDHYLPLVICRRSPYLKTFFSELAYMI